jgi:hypothetical protein
MCRTHLFRTRSRAVLYSTQNFFRARTEMSNSSKIIHQRCLDEIFLRYLRADPCDDATRTRIAPGMHSAKVEFLFLKHARGVSDCIYLNLPTCAIMLLAVLATTLAAAPLPQLRVRAPRAPGSSPTFVLSGADGASFVPRRMNFIYPDASIGCSNPKTDPTTPTHHALFAPAFCNGSACEGLRRGLAADGLTSCTSSSIMAPPAAPTAW